MTKTTYILRSLVSGAGVFIYVSGVAWLGFNSQNIFGEPKDSFLAPVFVLLLFIVSAVVTGFLVLGKPISLYSNGLKKEALILLGLTLAWLIIFLVVVALAIAV
ncbi:MAG: hypothetical protein Q8Q37_03020 [bacterium]|nr:hypothetical protein [bacterium]